MPHTRYSFLLTPVVVFFEFLVLFVTLFYFLNAQYITDLGTEKSIFFLIKSHYKAYIILSLTWYFIGSYFKIYDLERGRSLASLLQKTFFQLVLFSVILFAVSGIKTSDLFDIPNAIGFILSFSSIIFIFRISLIKFLRYIRKKGFNNRNILFIDQNSHTKDFIKLFQDRKDLGYKIAGIINGTDIDGLNVKNFNIQDFERVLKKFNIHNIYLSMEGELNAREIADIKLFSSKRKIPLNFIPSESLLGHNELVLNYLYTIPTLTQVGNPLDDFYNRTAKRMFDILVSFIGLLLLSVMVFPVLAILTFLDSGCPIFFKQKRKGIDEKVFRCYKFRTMRLNSDHDKKITKRGDERITKVGQILRKTSLDELPQLYNVLIGDMSLVGPRPHMLKQDEEYDEVIKYYSLRHHVKPGITGLAQISGFRGEINSKQDMDDRVRADIYYIKNWTFFLDIIIIFRTFVNLIKGDENAI